jgi:hypothetical protein
VLRRTLLEGAPKSGLDRRARLESLFLHLLIAIPTHSRTIEAETLVSLLTSGAAAIRRGWRLDVAFYAGPDLDELRNRMAGDMLAVAADALFMLDGDQAMDARLLERMVDSGHPVVGAMYPRRGYRWPEPPETPAADIATLLARATAYVGALRFDDSALTRVTVVDDFAPAAQVGGGCWLVRREPFERLQAAYPDLEGRGAPEDDPAPAGNWAFFTTLPDPVTGQPLTEDFAFSSRWLECGGALWLDVASSVLHVGRHEHRGAYVDHLESLAPRAQG